MIRHFTKLCDQMKRSPLQARPGGVGQGRLVGA
jgi:hypothetical protein